MGQFIIYAISLQFVCCCSGLTDCVWLLPLGHPLTQQKTTECSPCAVLCCIYEGSTNGRSRALLRERGRERLWRGREQQSERERERERKKKKSKHPDDRPSNRPHQLILEAHKSSRKIGIGQQPIQNNPANNYSIINHGEKANAKRSFWWLLFCNIVHILMQYIHTTVVNWRDHFQNQTMASRNATMPPTKNLPKNLQLYIYSAPMFRVGLCCTGSCHIYHS